MKTEAPKKIWISLPYGRHPDDWSFTDMPELANGRVAYVQAEEIERLETALRHISLASQSSMSSKEECGRIARAALAPEQS